MLDIKFALGPVEMLRQAIFDHKKQYCGRLPKRIEIHPAVLYDFLQNEEMKQFLLYMRTNDSIEFYGVQIVEEVQAAQPKLINFKNEVIYL